MHVQFFSRIDSMSVQNEIRLIKFKIINVHEVCVRGKADREKWCNWVRFYYAA